jgi:hypothetical protein
MNDQPSPDQKTSTAAPLGPVDATEPVEQHEPREQPPRAVRDLERAVNGLVAGADQQAAELHALNALFLVQAFAFGALAAIVFLQGRQIKELTGALAG